MTPSKHIAVVGAGMSALACARTLHQAGHDVSLFEKSAAVGGRMATRSSSFGSFDHGAQYFTVRDPRFSKALATTPNVCKPWSVSTVRVLDELGRTLAAGKPPSEAHWVPSPSMRSLPESWAAPLIADGRVYFNTNVINVQPDALNAKRWQIQTRSSDDGLHVYAGFDAVILALPAPQALALLRGIPARVTQSWAVNLQQVLTSPCWTLMLAYPQAMQPGFTTLGPQWNAARSTHHRIAWLARESSKPQRQQVERWTVQASAAWSQEHLQDEPERVQLKLFKAFAEITGIRAEPAHMAVHRWAYAKTETPLGKSHLWDAKVGLGICGDWCLGYRVEDAFVSGLELALAMV